MPKVVKAYNMQSYHRAIGCAPIELLEGIVLNHVDKQEGIMLSKDKKKFNEEALKNLDVYRQEYNTSHKMNLADNYNTTWL